MKKFVAMMLVLAMVFTFAACGGKEQPESTQAEAPFQVGSDTVEATAENSSAYDPTFTINLRIVGGGEEELFNGTVKLQSPTMWCSEFLLAAVNAKGLAQSGIETGYVETIGDYASNAAEQIFWFYYLNGESALFGCDKCQLRDGDYVEFVYEKYEG